MKMSIVFVLLLLSCASVYSQSEELVWVDTTQISSKLPKMIFKYYYSSEEYDFKETKRFGRFEIYLLGSAKPFQKDTLLGVFGAQYKDLNGDHILDLVVITMQATSGGGDYRDYFLYDPPKKRFVLWRSES